MKHWSLSLLLSSTLWALPTHSPNRPTYFHDDMSSFNPCDPCFLWQEALSWRISYQADFIYNRYLERRQNVHGAGDLQRVAFNSNGGAITVNAADWFEFFANMGATKFSITTPSKETTRETELFFSPRFSWSIGMRATVWKCGPLAFGFWGDYFRTEPKLDAFLDYGSGTVTYFNNNEDSTYYEWNAAFGGSYTFQGPGCMEFIPHLAGVASGAKMGLRGVTFVNNGTSYHLLNLKDKRLWGYALGLNWITNRQVAIGAEVRFGDQKGFHIIGELAF